MTFLGTEADGRKYLNLTFGLMKRTFEISNNSNHRIDAIVALKIMIAMIENL